MQLARLLAHGAGMILLSAAGLAQAQGKVIVTMGSGWSINTTSGPVLNSMSLNVPGGGDDLLLMGSSSSGGTFPAAFNLSQSSVDGERSEDVPMSGATSASSHAFTSFFKSGPLGNVVSTAVCTPSGTLPPFQKVNMTASAQIEFILGVFGTTQHEATLSKAVVKAPGPQGGHLGLPYNKLVLNQGPAINPNFGPIFSFYYSTIGDTGANCTLKQGDTAFCDARVVADSTINLQ